MSSSSDCAALATSFPGSFTPSNCCTSGFVTCNASGRVTSLNMGCSSGGQPWIGGTLPSQLSALTALQKMFFDDCGMKGPLPDIWANFPQLFELHLSYPPASWGYANDTAKYPLYLNGNNFEGKPQWRTIPASFSQMSLLYTHLQSNRFTGPVPSSLVSYIASSDTIKSQCGGKSGNSCFFMFEKNCLTGVPTSVSSVTGVYVTGDGDERDGVGGCAALGGKLNGGGGGGGGMGATSSVATTVGAVVTSSVGVVSVLGVSSAVSSVLGPANNVTNVASAVVKSSAAVNGQDGVAILGLLLMVVGMLVGEYD
ncbi:hypothetical protein HDU98_002471 [Podochytrium sp. JEL0797]|nr:hypothetical protein HDU98_002471 [Podochytrium sp. JEL0797]